jgi:Ca2+-binding RTX toxin-like protein
VSLILRANVENLVLTGSDAMNGTGNALDNVITGNGATNYLYGADGNDTLIGGAGRDFLYGGMGSDTFRFGDGDFGGSTATTADRIVGFSQSDGDRIDLHLVDAVTAAAGDQDFHFLGTAAFSHTAGELRYEEIGANTYVSGDTNGDGAADFMIRIDGLHSLTSGDFVL